MSVTNRKFDDLPDNVIIQIFENLCATERVLIEKVCNRWNYLSTKSWSKFYRLEFWQFRNVGAIEKVLYRCGNYLKTLEIRKCDAEPENVLSFIAQSCHNLIELQFTWCNFSNLDVQLSNIFSSCPLLTRLDLSANEKLSGNCFVDIPRELKCLDLVSCRNLRIENIQIIASRCSNLEVLYLPYLRSSPLTVTCFEFTFQRLTKLRVLKFKIYCNVQQLQPLLLSLSNLNQLREIDLNCNHWVNNETVHVISRSCLYMERIGLLGCSDITDVALLHLSTLKRLTSLDLSGCFNITDVGVKLLAELGDLKYLYLINCRKVTDVSMIEIAKGCRNLTELMLQYTSITDASIWAFYDNADERKSVALTLCVTNTKVTFEKTRRICPMLLIIWL